MLLQSGMADDPLDHARQVAMVTSILFQELEASGLQCALVGGSAIEVYAPGIFKSGDLDLVIEDIKAPNRVRDRAGAVFETLGFKSIGRHWKRDDLFVEIPSTTIEEPTELVRVGAFVLRVVRKEVLLSDRIVGFKHWKHTAYGQQAIDMIAAFGDSLDSSLLIPRLEREGSIDAFEELTKLAASQAPVTEQVLQSVLERLSR
jgi:hypothetical protein